MIIKNSLKYMLTLFGIAMLSSPGLFANANTTALVGATVFTAPDREPIENGVVIIEGSKISRVGSSGQIEIPKVSKIIDVSGQFITAGYWNSHVHYTGPLQNAADEDNESLGSLLSDMFLRWGFVGTVDTGSWLEKTLAIRKRITSGEVAGPQILIIGGSFVPVGGSPYYIKPIRLPEFNSPQQAGQLVADALAAGADGIKLFTGSWGTPSKVTVMEAEHILAATKQAHSKGALVFAHPSDSDGARVAIENGVDVLAHAFPAQIKGPWDKSLIDLMSRNNVALVPTLKLWRYDLSRESFPLHIINMVELAALEQVKLANENGVTILFGTDVGYMTDADTSEEYRLLGLAGLNYKEILASLTTAPASQYGLDETNGLIKESYAADIVILNSDPRESVTAFADVDKTIRNGEIVFQP